MESAELPLVTFVIPLFNAARTLDRCVSSALRQRGVNSRVIIVDHGSQDKSLTIANQLSFENPRVEVIELTRSAHDRRTPARPLNVGFSAALRSPTPADRSWVCRLDADDLLLSDDVVATQLAAGGYRALITATVVFFNQSTSSAYEYGPWPRHRSLESLRRHGVYSVAHHANAMRCDLLVRISERVSSLFDESLDFGEDLGLTCILLRSLAATDFAFIDSPYCFKALGSGTATSSITLGRLWSSHLQLLRRNPELSTYAALRGLTEIVLARIVGERAARRSLQHLAGRNGFYHEIDYSKVVARLREFE